MAERVKSGFCGPALPFFLALTLAAAAIPAAASRPRRLTYRLIASYPHDPSAFTQGLVCDKESLIESTGLYGRSELRRVKPASGALLKVQRLPGNVFGEGVTVFHERIYQLTWREGLCLVYDRSSLAKLQTLPLSFCREGWGLTHDGSRLIVSDGSSSLYFVDAETLALQRRLAVRDENGPLANLNELEYCRGRIFANIWQSNFIVAIDPASGWVGGRLDCSPLVPAALRDDHQNAVLNGIAYNPATGHFYITGKLWPTLYEIEINE